MTHDELLAKIASFSCCSGAVEIALLAVVEMHKPVRRGAGEPYCDAICQWDYPCSTIQTIQKALA